ncbi:MAG: thioesterase family protein [Pseudomonadota bacterium]
MSSLQNVIDQFVRDDESLTLDAPPAWSQGRTLYGGMTAALCHEAARPLIDPGAHLRSAQFAFVGPASGSLRLIPTVARQGRSSSVVTVDMVAEDTLAAKAIFTFGSPRESVIAFDRGSFPSVPPPEDCHPLFPPGGTPASFFNNFDMRTAAGSALISGGAPDLCLWVRFGEEQTVNPVTALLALADAPPPAAMTLFPQPAAISTATWAIDLMHGPADANAWHLLRSTGEQAVDGYAMQDMTLWDSTGRRLIQGRQCVAIFI